MLAIDRLCKLQSRVNSVEFRGCPAGTLMLHRWHWIEGKARMIFRHRPSGYEMQIMDGISHKVYGEVDFKYQLRAMHRAGLRKVSLSVRTYRETIKKFSVDTGED